MSSSRVIFGVQPVVEAIRSGHQLDRIYLARAAGGQTTRIRRMATKEKIPIVEATKEEITKRAGTDSHQGVMALLDTNEIATVEVEQILDIADERGQPPLLLLLDGIQDPQNFGAIIRSAHALGAHGIVIPKHRAAQVTPAVVRASAGAAMHLAVSRVTNLKRALETLAKHEVWTAAAVMGGEPVHKARLDGPLALVIGGEAKGVRPSVASECDSKVSIPLGGGFDSLNASVAAGILLYEANRQRGAR